MRYTLERTLARTLATPHSRAVVVPLPRPPPPVNPDDPAAATASAARVAADAFVLPRACHPSDTAVTDAAAAAAAAATFAAAAAFRVDDEEGAWEAERVLRKQLYSRYEAQIIFSIYSMR